MAQFNLIEFCLVSHASPTGAVEKFLDADFILTKYWHTKWVRVDSVLKNMIYCHLIDKYERYRKSEYDRKILIEILDERGDVALKEADMATDFMKLCITGVEFNNSLLLWHIATDICYHHDCDKYGADILGPHCQISKHLSDYMVYLQIVRPGMLPTGIGEVRFRDTCNEVMRFLPKKKDFSGAEVSKALLVDNADRPLIRIPGKTKAIMLEATKLAVYLQQLVTDRRWGVERKWKLMSQVWVEMLTYAAGHCGWKEHIQELQRGRELLTHVSLLMAHFGLTKKIQIEDLPSHLEQNDYQPPWKWDTLDHLAYYLA